jgi:hypothetical protein
MSYFEHRFETTIVRLAVGTLQYTVVVLPADIASVLPLAGGTRLRIEADVSGVPVKGAWQPSGGRWYLMLPQQPLKHAGLGIGSPVEVSFRQLPQDAVDVPVELQALLQADAPAASAWQALTPGTQRGLAIWLQSARKAETRQARLHEVRRVLLGERPPPWKRRESGERQTDRGNRSMVARKTTKGAA